MTKISITLTDFPVIKLGELAALLSGSAPAAITAQSPAPTALTPGSYALPPTNVEEDDETGDSAPVAAGTLDGQGFPHDNRIHSEPAKLTAKGVWRKKRGVTNEEVAQVEAELRSRETAPAPVTPPVTMPPPAPQPVMQPAPVPAPVQQPTPAPMPAPVQQPVTMPPPAPVPAPVQQPAPTGSVDFSGFMQRIQAMLPTGIVDAGYLSSVAQRIGAAFQQPVNAITDIANNQQMIDYAVQIMASEGRWQ